jgi:hypothetical protein
MRSARDWSNPAMTSNSCTTQICSRVSRHYERSHSHGAHSSVSLWNFTFPKITHKYLGNVQARKDRDVLPPLLSTSPSLMVKPPNISTSIHWQKIDIDGLHVSSKRQYGSGTSTPLSKPIQKLSAFSSNRQNMAMARSKNQ